MQRLTEERGQRTWQLFRVGWYINIALVILVLLAALYYLGGAWAGDPAEADRNVIMMAAMLIIASVLLMGAGISRYEARLEGQHLELKLALKRLGEELDSLRSND